MKNLLKTTLLLSIFMSVSILSVNAQKSSSKGLTAKIGNTQWKSNAKTCTAVWDSSNGTLTITATNNNETITIQLKSEGRVYTKGFTVGEYYFARNTIYNDNYSINALYSNGDTDWKDNDDEERTVGKIQITEISATSVKGKFYFDLTKRKYINKEKDLFIYDKTNTVSVTEGSFDINLTTK
jgi:uncharacterized cupin superfamily protein